MKYFVDETGAYLGAWDQGGPDNGVEVPLAPEDARQIWFEGVWIYPSKTPTQVREEFKAQRELEVSRIKVTSSLGRVFDGAEVDTTRMLKPITVLKEKPTGTTVTWVLADNTVVDVALDEFLEVVEKAGLEQTRLWIQPNDEA